MRRSTQNTYGPAEVPEEAQSYVDDLEGVKVDLRDGMEKFSKCHSFSTRSSCQQFSEICSEVANCTTVYTDLSFPYSVELVRRLTNVLSYTDEKNFKTKFQKKIKGTSFIADFEKLVREQRVLPNVYRQVLANLKELRCGAPRTKSSIRTEAERKQDAARNGLENARLKKARKFEDAKRFDAEAVKCDSHKKSYDEKKERYQEEERIFADEAYVEAPPVTFWGAVRNAYIGAEGLKQEATRKSEEARILKERNAEMGEECARNQNKAIEDAERARADGENAILAARQATEEAEDYDRAAELLRTDMIDCLSLYIKALEKVSQFFCDLESELEKCYRKVKNARTTRNNDAILECVNGILRRCEMYETFQRELRPYLPSYGQINKNADIEAWCDKRLQPHETRDILNRLGLQSRAPKAYQSSGPMLIVVKHVLNSFNLRKNSNYH